MAGKAGHHKEKGYHQDGNKKQESDGGSDIQENVAGLFHNEQVLAISVGPKGGKVDDEPESTGE